MLDATINGQLALHQDFEQFQEFQGPNPPLVPWGSMEGWRELGSGNHSNQAASATGLLISWWTMATSRLQ